MKSRVPRNRRPFSRTEWMLLGSPLLVLALFAAWRFWRQAPRQKLLVTPVPIYKALGVADNRVIGLTQLNTTESKNPAVVPEFLTLESNGDEAHRTIRETMWVESASAVASPNGKRVAVAARPFDFWNASIKTGASAIEIHDTSPDFKLLKSWRPPIGNARRDILQWVSNDELLVICSDTALLYNVSQGVLLHTYPLSRWLGGDASEYAALCVSPDHRWAAVLESQRELPPSLTPELLHPRSSFSSRNNTGEQGNYGRRMIVVSWPDGALQKQLAGDLWYAPTWTPQGDLIALSPLIGGDKVLRIDVAHYNPQTRQTSRITLQDDDEVDYFSAYWLNSMRFAPDARCLVQAVSNTGYLIWNVATGEKLPDIDAVPKFKKARLDIDPLPAFSLDGRFLLSPRPDGVEMIDLRRYVP